MRQRKACVRGGHRWIAEVNGFRMPVQFCSRWLCQGARPDPSLPEAVRDGLDRELWSDERLGWRDRFDRYFGRERG